jgi:hypothetical protein
MSGKYHDYFNFSKTTFLSAQETFSGNHNTEQKNRCSRCLVDSCQKPMGHFLSEQRYTPSEGEPPEE